MSCHVMSCFCYFLLFSSHLCYNFLSFLLNFALAFSAFSILNFSSPLLYSPPLSSILFSSAGCTTPTPTPPSMQSLFPLNSLISYHHFPEPLLCLRSQVWDVATQYCIQTIVGHRCEIWSLVVHYPHQSTGESSQLKELSFSKTSFYFLYHYFHLLPACVCCLSSKIVILVTDN